MSTPPPRIARRLAHLEGIDLSEEDIQSIVADFEDYERALADLGAFAEGVVWVDAPIQPDITHGDNGPR